MWFKTWFSYITSEKFPWNIILFCFLNRFNFIPIVCYRLSFKTEWWYVVGHFTGNKNLIMQKQKHHDINKSTSVKRLAGELGFWHELMRTKAGSVKKNNIKKKTKETCLFIECTYKYRLFRELGLVKAAPWIKCVPK